MLEDARTRATTFVMMALVWGEAGRASTNAKK
jgi:hypothetical protein